MRKHVRRLTLCAIAAITGAVTGFALARAHSAEFLLEGPITIEEGVKLKLTGQDPKIVYVDKNGDIWFRTRSGVPVQLLNKEDLVLLVYELVAYEVMLHSPPHERRACLAAAGGCQ